MSDIIDDDDDDIIFDSAALAQLSAVEQAVQTGALPPKSGLPPNLKQRTLFGGTVQPLGGSSKQAGPAVKARATKKWDFSSFSRLGWSTKRATQAKAKGKGKRKAYASDEEPWGDEEDVLDDDDEVVEAQNVSVAENEGKRLPIKWPPDSEAIKTWHYPVQADKPLRVYQRNIAYQCLLDNTLVSLPTGLGKTFIAACVMLNFFRWYPEGKIIFLAPTRPLVTQQIKACHYIAGIPQSDCIELTGQTPATLRGVAWATKRVIYCTPQTLENDLKKGRVDPRDVVCLVTDEAHRASGDYAYCGVVRFIMSRNEHFRILALTATPGARGEAVQDVIDNLHIGHVEVRTDASLDIKPYMHQKSYDLCIIPLNNTPIAKLRDQLAAIMQTYILPLSAVRLIYEVNATMITPFSVQRAFGDVNKLPGGKSNGKYYPMIKSLQSLARAMEYLLVQSVTSCMSSLEDACSGNQSLALRPEMRQLLSDIKRIRSMPGYVGHPKMQRLRQMCEQHFNEAAASGHADTRVMIFCNFREVVEEIVDCLNALKPLIKATPFIGQGTAKGVRGKSQKEQIETIRKFKQGTYNVLVATSIGEEGLDIGEIDLIVCYEANKSPVRMLQRVGRTGRARDGKIIVFMSEGREERNWDKAKDAYSEVQNALTSNKVFDLYSDGDRMIPPDVKPECVQVDIQAKPLDLEAITMAGQNRLIRKTTAEEKKAAAAARKKQRDPQANVPKDAFMGFRAAGELAKEKQRKSAKSDAEIMRERKEAALLSVEEQVELRKWQFVNDVKVKPVAVDTYNASLFATKPVLSKHGRRHDLANEWKSVSDDFQERPAAFDAWYDSMTVAFNADLIQPWDAAMRSKPKSIHPDLRKRTEQPAPPKTFTQMAPPFASSAALAPSSKAKPPSSDSPPRSNPHIESDVKPRVPTQPLVKPSQVTKTAPNSSARRVTDPYGILSSSSDDELSVLVKPCERESAKALSARKGEAPASASTDYGLNDDDIDMDIIEQMEKDVQQRQRQQQHDPQKKVKSSPRTPIDIEIPESDDEATVPPLKPTEQREVSTSEKMGSAYDLVLSDDDNDHHAQQAEMPPPPLPVKVKPSPASVPLERPRQQRHIVPDTSSSAGKHERSSLRTKSDEPSPVKVVKRRADGGRIKKKQGVVESSDDDDEVVEAPRPRKKLRRAGESRERIDQNDDDGLGENGNAKKSTPPKKKRRPKVTDRDLAKHRIIDFEAVNSEASGTEASTESYDSENSIDRDFVAVDDSIDVDADQARFYRESLLMSQHPAFAPNPWKRNLLQPRGQAAAHAPPSTPESHDPQDDWSYDSFCVRSDEPIERVSSSEQ